MIAAATASTPLPLRAFSWLMNAWQILAAREHRPPARAAAAAANLASREFAKPECLIAPLWRNCRTSSLMLSGFTMMVKVTEFVPVLFTLSVAVILKVWAPRFIAVRRLIGWP